jgi:tetratricopeptide (TPR) repeat protein
MSQEHDLAMQRVRAGRGIEGEEIMRQAVQYARDHLGPQSAVYAERLYELATILLAVGDKTRALPLIVEAAGVRDPDGGYEGEKQRLMYGMNVGDVLMRLGRLDEAEAAMRENVAAREALYGKEHAGFAYGVEQLADVLRARGETDEALRLADVAVDVFWSTGNPRIAAALATRAPLAKLKGLAAFDRVTQLPDELFDSVVDESLARESVDDPAVHLLVTRELWGVAATRHGAAAPKAMRVAARVVRTARNARAFDVARNAAEALLSAFDAAGDARGAVDAALGLAGIEDAAGRIEVARTRYEDAVKRAKGTSDAALLSKVLRNRALFLVERGEVAAGRSALEEAVRVAATAGATEMAARARIALGVNLQHDGDLARARALLEAATGLLDLEDPDALCARSHLGAILNGGDCGCGDMPSAFADALRAMVEREIGPGLIAELRCTSADGSKLDVRLARPPTEGEVERLDLVVKHSLAVLRKRIRESA